MAKDYAPTAAKTQTMLAKFGLPVTLKQQSGGTYNPATGSYSGGFEFEYPCTGLIRFPNFMGRGEQWLAGVEVQATDKFLLLAASDLEVEPAPGDKLDVGGVDYVILVSMPLEPGGVKLLYRVLARK